MQNPVRTAAQAIGLFVLALTIGVAVYFAARVTTESPVATPPAPAKLAPTPPSTGVNRRAERPAAPVAQLQMEEAAATTERTQGPDLAGIWELYVQEDTDEYEYGRYRLEYRDGQLTGSMIRREDGCVVTLDGMSIRIVQNMGERRVWTFSGTFNPAYTEAKGSLETVYRADKSGKEEYHEKYDAQIVRVSEKQLADEKRSGELRAARCAEAQSIFDALKRFAERNGGKFPASLAQLTPDDISDMGLLAEKPGRRIVYDGNALLTRADRLSKLGTEFKERGLSTESLVDYERGLREAWGGQLPFAARPLRVEYFDPPFAIDIASDGNERTSDEGEAEPPGGEQTPDSLRVAEFNNLKQLRIVLKMFSNENRGYLPGGWVMVYPEYVTDMRVLTSPWAAEGTDSYELLFPGKTEKQLEELVRSLAVSGTLPTLSEGHMPWQADIPAIASRDELPSEPGKPPARAVLFLDGHVEAVPLSEWDTRIAPFLNR